jgi:hypothetical protein
MHPSIAQLVRDTLCPNLEDAPSVTEYPEVMGMRKRLFWLDHRVPENDFSEADGNSSSHWNSHEIKMTLALVNHLVQQGEYKKQDIAVLTPYLGQLHRLRQQLGKSHALMLEERRISTKLASKTIQRRSQMRTLLLSKDLFSKCSE